MFDAFAKEIYGRFIRERRRDIENNEDSTSSDDESWKAWNSQEGGLQT